MYNIHLLPASFGDSILIEYGEESTPKYILIDGGPYFVFDEVLAGIKRVAPDLQQLELLVVTHIDIDHIDGIIVLLNRDQLPFKIKQIWFNGWDQIVDAQRDLMGGKQGEYLSALIKKSELPHNTSVQGKPIMIDADNQPRTIEIDDDFTLTIISPSQSALADLASEWEKVVEDVGDEDKALERLEEDHRYEYDISDMMGEMDIVELQASRESGDKSEANGSSIAFIGTYQGKRCLFAGDAHSEKLEAVVDQLTTQEGTDKLELDAWKLAHHGSRKSTLSDLMQKIACKKILISSDGKRYKHPDAETLAKLIMHNGPNLEFYFNFKTQYTEPWADSQLSEEHKFQSYYPEDDGSGITVKLGSL